MRTPLHCPQLTPDDRYWRVDWFGEVAYPGTVRRYSQPSIKVCISPLVDPNTLRMLFDTPMGDCQQQRSVWMPWGSLLFLRIGDVWHQGRPVEMIPRDCEVFRDLVINPSTVTIIKAGHSVDDHFLLPFSEHAGHRAHTHAYCLAVAAGASTLVIPCVELIRFYFGSSSWLLHQLLTGPFQTGNLWREMHFDPVTQHLHLKLKAWANKAAAADLGRIALSDQARRAAAMIYLSCLRASSQGEKIYPYMGLPFMGMTSLGAHGNWLSYDGQPNRTFLVYRLVNCSHPFPFKSITYECGERSVSRRKQEDRQSSPKSGSGSRFDERKAALGDADPGAQKARRIFRVDDGVRFPDLTNKRVWEESVVALQASGVILKHSTGALEQVAFGEPPSTNEGRGVDAVRQEGAGDTEGPLPKLPAWVRTGVTQAILALGYSAQRVSSKIIVVTGAADPVIALPMVVDEDGVVDAIPLFTDPAGHQRTRQVCFVALQRMGETIRLVGVVEGRKITEQPCVLEVHAPDVLDVVQRLYDIQ